jgi:hypothetical protein
VIALLALVCKFIIVDVKTLPPAMIGALAAAALSLDLVYWLVRNPAERDELYDEKHLE